MPTIDELRLLQALPLELKVEKTKARIREFVEHYGEDNVAVAFSGGKDSTVLLHIVREIYPNVLAVFINTGLEYPELQHFVRQFENVEIVRPTMRFDEVIKKYGYPFISKEVANCVYWAKKTKNPSRIARLTGEWTDKNGTLSKYNQAKWKPLLDVDFDISDRCCTIMKKLPAKKIHKAQITGTMTEESILRKTAWLKTGCNAFDSNKSSPMSFWTEQDVLRYIKQNGIEICSIYGNIVGESELKCTGCSRSGCIFCGFGCHLEKESRFQRLKITHPKQYDYCMSGGEHDENGIWKPNKNGLGMAHCIDVLNKIYGKDFIKY